MFASIFLFLVFLFILKLLAIALDVWEPVLGTIRDIYRSVFKNK